MAFGPANVPGPCAAEQVIFAPGETGMTSENVQEAIEELFTSVSDGKKLVASAITDKGIPTAADAAFQTMRENILKISTIPNDVYKLTLVPSPADGGTVSGGGYISKGMRPTVSAAPASGFTFDSWMQGTKKLSSDVDYRFNMPEGNVTLTAAFQKAGWRSAVLPFPQYWSAIAFGNGKFVAIALYSDKAAYSIDGVTWEIVTLPFSGTWSCITWGGGKFVALDSTDDNSNKAIYSTDGIHWTVATLPVSGSWKGITYANGKFVAVSNTSDKAVYSTDGITWKSSKLPSYGSWRCIAYGHEKFVAVNANAKQAAYSTDGITWTSTSLPFTSGNCIAYGNERFVVGTTTQSNQTAYSIDGITWIETELPSNAALASIAYDGGGFMGMSAVPSTSFYSTDGIVWEKIPTPGGSISWADIAYGNGMCVAVGHNTNIAAIFAAA